MKRLVIVCAFVCLGALLCTTALAQDQRPTGDRQRTARDQMQAGGQMIKDALAQLDLTAEQKEKVAKIQKDFDEKLKAENEKTAKEREELQKQMQEARAAGDREKMSEVRTKLNQLSAGASKLVTEYSDAVKAVLTAEQKQKLEKLMQPAIQPQRLLAVIRDNAEALKLTDEQKESLKKLESEVVPPNMDKVQEEVKAKTEEMKKNNASQEEIDKATQAIRDKARQKIADQNRDFQAKVEKVLTEEQRTKLRELLQSQAGRGQGMRQRGQRPAPAPAAEPKKDAVPGTIEK